MICCIAFRFHSETSTTISAIGRACAFPFTYKDRTYTQCTQVDETTPWCALETEGDGTFDPHRNDWAFCTGPAEC